MSYDTDYLVADYIGYVKALLRYAGNEAHALRLARALEIRVRIGTVNRSFPELPDGPRVVVQPWWYGNNDVVRHELAHVMLWWSGLEREILEEFGDELGWRVVENLCNHAVTFLRMPQTMVDEAVRRHGVTARAVGHLRKLSGARPDEAMRRLVYDDLQAPRAGFLTSGLYIREVAQCNLSLPFSWLERVPEPTLKFPPEARASFLTLPGGTSLIGVCAG
ncbi:hypothetical protein [Deinococcus sp. S9]|uniref:hypothetical protein n=1 Tax=Deinococcus sp. S9 TaxID=2545754 RepID=UPI001054CDA7|nr:hypothetical protein [Deinococcus sp. S9]TDE85320.1 hypothetical protein E0686_12360 [Deinococcus sp. S9]